MPRAVAMQQVHRYAMEIVPAFNAYVYFRFGYWISKSVARMLYRVRLGYADTEALTGLDPKSTVVFVMNHRSNMDYILVSFLAAERVAAGYLGHQLLLRLQGRSFRNRYACVNFGKPISMRTYARDNNIDFRALDDTARRAAITQLGAELMHQIGFMVPVLPVPLVATVLLREPTAAMSELELKAAVNNLILGIEALGARVYVPRHDQDYAINFGVRMLLLRHMVLEQDGLYRANPKELVALQYYANSIAHLSARVVARPPPVLAGAA